MIKLKNFSRIIDLQNYKFQCFLPLNRPLTLNVSRLKVTIRGTKFDLEKVKYFCQIFLFCWSFGNCWLLNRPGRQFVVVLFYGVRRIGPKCRYLTPTAQTKKQPLFWWKLNVMKNPKTGNKIHRKSKSYKKNKKQPKKSGTSRLKYEQTRTRSRTRI